MRFLLSLVCSPYRVGTKSPQQPGNGSSIANSPTGPETPAIPWRFRFRWEAECLAVAEQSWSCWDLPDFPRISRRYPRLSRMLQVTEVILCVSFLNPCSRRAFSSQGTLNVASSRRSSKGPGGLVVGCHGLIVSNGMPHRQVRVARPRTTREKLAYQSVDCRLLRLLDDAVRCRTPALVRIPEGR